jgi:hypothetical protein
MNSRINPHWIVVDIEPSIALARAECLDTFRKLPAQKPRTFGVMKDARTARAIYQRELLRQFTNYVMSFARSTRHPDLNYPADLQPSLSAASPRGA